MQQKKDSLKRHDQNRWSKIGLKLYPSWVPFETYETTIILVSFVAHSWEHLSAWNGMTKRYQQFTFFLFLLPEWTAVHIFIANFGAFYALPIHFSFTMLVAHCIWNFVLQALILELHLAFSAVDLQALSSRLFYKSWFCITWKSFLKQSAASFQKSCFCGYCPWDAVGRRNHSQHNRPQRASMHRIVCDNRTVLVHQLLSGQTVPAEQLRQTQTQPTTVAISRMLIRGFQTSWQRSMQLLVKTYNSLRKLF